MSNILYENWPHEDFTTKEIAELKLTIPLHVQEMMDQLKENSGTNGLLKAMEMSRIPASKLTTEKKTDASNTTTGRNK